MSFRVISSLTPRRNPDTDPNQGPNPNRVPPPPQQAGRRRPRPGAPLRPQQPGA
ncbi:hypothetical protein [Streptomyces sp. NPDC002588]|uniref:hypothetical protein n=1 Tax=Streptomyces sp. NPDC002588 TaxID=3154419 RepID=UPI003332DA83